MCSRWFVCEHKIIFGWNPEALTSRAKLPLLHTRQHFVKIQLIHLAIWKSNSYPVSPLTNSFYVSFFPLPRFPTNNFSVVHIIASYFSPTNTFGLFPSKNHWITNTFKHSDVIWWRWSSCFRAKCLLLEQNNIVSQANIYMNVFRLILGFSLQGKSSQSLEILPRLH